MKIEYNILWLDDQIDEFTDDELVDRLINHIEEEGFKANVVTVSKYGDFIKYLDDSYDLILTDYRMSEKNGDKVVEEIRSRNNFTEILFYTAQRELNLKQKINRISFLETGSFSGGHHEIVVNEAIKLIDLTIKKFQHIVAMRGMIMHETSYLDAMSEDILKSYISCEEKCTICSNHVKCEPISSEIFKGIKSNINEKKQKVDSGNLSKVMKDHFLFSAEYKNIALGKIINALGYTDFSKDYKKEIINVRNQFAHAVLKKDAEGREYFEKDGVTFDKKLCKKIRKDINKHKMNFDGLRNRLK